MFQENVDGYQTTKLVQISCLEELLALRPLIFKNGMASTSNDFRSWRAVRQVSFI